MRLGKFLSYRAQIFSHWFSHVCTSFYFYPDEVWKKKSVSAHPTIHHIYIHNIYALIRDLAQLLDIMDAQLSAWKRKLKFSVYSEGNDWKTHIRCPTGSWHSGGLIEGPPETHQYDRVLWCTGGFKGVPKLGPHMIPTDSSLSVLFFHPDFPSCTSTICVDKRYPGALAGPLPSEEAKRES